MPDLSTPATTPKKIILRKYRRLPLRERRRLQKAAARAYARGDSIRTIAAAIGHSYGTTHRILTDAGVALRRRGVPTRNRDDHGTATVPPRQRASR